MAGDNPLPDGGEGEEHLPWFCSLMEMVPDPAAFYRADGSLLFLNQPFLDTFGWSFEEMASESAGFVPPERAREAAEVRRLVADGQGQALRTRRRSRQGRELEVLWHLSPCQGTDGPDAGHMEVFSDLSREMDHRRRLETLLELSVRLPGFGDLDSLLHFLSEKTKELLEAESASLILLDPSSDELFFRHVLPPDSEMAPRFREVRFPASEGLAGHVVSSQKPLHISDVRSDPRFYPHVDAKTGFLTRNLVYAPLVVRGRATGVLGAVNRKEGDFDRQDMEFLQMVAHTVALAVENARVMEELRNAREELTQSLAEKEMMLQEIHHRVKNNMQIIISMLNLQQGSLEDQAAKSALSDCQERLGAMALVHETVHQSGEMGEVDLREYVRVLANGLFRAYAADREVEMEITAEPVVIGLDDAVPLGLAVNELVTNCFRHAFSQGAGKIILQARLAADGRLELVVADDGPGLPPEVERGAHPGLGLFLVRGLVENQLGGSLEASSAGGARFVVRFTPKPLPG
jgi:PAS domain S-box-containing protein